jgi:hypothetical protein
MNRHIALKVVKSAPRYTENALDEIKLLRRLTTSSTPPFPSTLTQSTLRPRPGRSCVISFLDNFKSALDHASPSTKLVDVPPSKDREGNQTSRSESISIRSSQPLPSSSFGSSPMLDKLAFGMNKIDEEGTKLGSGGSTGAIVPRER